MPLAVIIDPDPNMRIRLSGCVRQYFRRHGERWQIEAFPTSKNLRSFCDIAVVSANDGLEGARWIRKRDKRAAILLTSDTGKYVLQGYDLSIAAYLLTPVEPSLLEEGLDTALRRLGQCGGYIDLPAAGGTCREVLNAILCIEREGNGCRVRTYNGSYLLTAPLESLRLPQCFFLCDGGWINLMRVQRITGGRVWMDIGNLALPVSAGVRRRIISSMPGVISAFTETV